MMPPGIAVFKVTVSGFATIECTLTKEISNRHSQEPGGVCRGEFLGIPPTNTAFIDSLQTAGWYTFIFPKMVQKKIPLTT